MRFALLFPLGVLALTSPGCRHDEAARPPSPPDPVTAPASPKPEYELITSTYEGDTVTLGEVDRATGELIPPPPLLQAPFPESIHPRCEHVMPRELTERFFPASEGWIETRIERFDPTTCDYQLGETSVSARATYECGEGKSPPRPGSYEAKVPEGATVVEKLGHLAYFAREQAGLRLDVWDDDTPCRLVVRWQGPQQEQQVVALGRKVMAAARPDTVLRPTKLALYWRGDAATPDIGPWFSQWKQEVEAKLVRRFELAPGYPRVAPGAEVHDDEPDREVFLLGICEHDDQAAHMFRELHYYDSEVVARLGVRARVVEATEKDLACPRRLP